MAAKPRRMTKRQAGSVICDGQPLTVIDESAITPRRVELRCQCDRRHMIDVTPAVRMAIDDVTRGALALPQGDWRVTLNIGYDGAVLSAQLIR